MTTRRTAVFAAFCAGLTLWPIFAAGAETAAANAQDGWRSARAAEAGGDYPTMARILLPLAEEGDVAAQYTVGLLYDTGQAGRRDHAEAAKWYRKAAEKGFARAQYYLAYIYYNDDGDLRNYAEAMKWYRRSADQGTAMAQHSLGIMYAKGQGTAQDLVEAYKWFSLAASRLPGTAGTGYQHVAAKARDAAAAKMTPAQIAEGQKRVREWSSVNEQVPGKNMLVE